MRRKNKENNTEPEEVIIPENGKETTIVDLTQPDEDGNVAEAIDNILSMEEAEETIPQTEIAPVKGEITGDIDGGREAAIAKVKDFLYQCRTKHPGPKSDGKMNAIYVIERDRGQRVYFNFPMLSAGMMIEARSYCREYLSREEFLLLVIQEMQTSHPRFYTGVDIIYIE